MPSITQVKLYLTVVEDDKERQDYAYVSIVGPNGQYHVQHYVICAGNKDNQDYYWDKGYHFEFSINLEHPMPVDHITGSTLQVESGPVPGGDFGSWRAHVWLDGFADNGSAFQLIRHDDNAKIIFEDDTQSPPAAVVGLIPHPR